MKMKLTRKKESNQRRRKQANWNRYYYYYYYRAVRTYCTVLEHGYGSKTNRNKIQSNPSLRWHGMAWHGMATRSAWTRNRRDFGLVCGKMVLQYCTTQLEQTRSVDLSGQFMHTFIRFASIFSTQNNNNNHSNNSILVRTSIL